MSTRVIQRTPPLALRIGLRRADSVRASAQSADRAAAPAMPVFNGLQVLSTGAWLLQRAPDLGFRIPLQRLLAPAGEGAVETEDEEDPGCVPTALWPFPFAEAFSPWGQWSAASELYNDPNLDAVQLNVNLGGAAAAWQDADTRYDLGLVGSAVPSRTWDWLTFESGWYDPSDGWVDMFGAVELTNATVQARYTANDQTAPGAVSPGLRAYPGVATLPWMPDIGVPLVNLPTWYEQWFSENPAKASNKVFHGHTHLGAQVHMVQAGARWSNSDGSGYIKRLVFGLMRTGVNIEEATTADMIVGGVMDGTPDGGTLELCLGGTVVKTITHAHQPTAVEMRIERGGAPAAAFDGRSDAVTYLDGAIRTFVTGSVGPSSVDWFDAGYEGYPDGVAPIDTYDVKLAFYVDSAATSPADNPSAFTNGFGMFTHPGWDAVCEVGV